MNKFIYQNSCIFQISSEVRIDVDGEESCIILEIRVILKVELDLREIQAFLRESFEGPKAAVCHQDQMGEVELGFAFGVEGDRRS